MHIILFLMTKDSLSRVVFAFVDSGVGVCPSPTMYEGELTLEPRPGDVSCIAVFQLDPRLDCENENENEELRDHLEMTLKEAKVPYYGFILVEDIETDWLCSRGHMPVLVHLPAEEPTPPSTAWDKLQE